MITIEILTNMKISMMTMMVMAIINNKKRQVKSNYFRFTTLLHSRFD